MKSLTIGMPEVSVCIITYNHEPYIRECLDSIVNQETNFKFEVVIRDDNSKDATLHILEEYRLRYPNIIKILPSSTNLGMNKNFRKVIDAAVGKYIAICEGDDYWRSDKKLQIQYDTAIKHSEMNFFIHACYCVNSASEIVNYT